MDADAIHDPPRLRRIDVALGHHVLDRHCAFDGGDDGGKFQQKAITHSLDDPVAEIRNDRNRAPPLLYPPRLHSLDGNSRRRRPPL
jgi:hypothetical protein